MSDKAEKRLTNRALAIQAKAKVAQKKQLEEQAKKVATTLVPKPTVRRRRGVVEPAWGRADVRADKDANAAPDQDARPVPGAAAEVRRSIGRGQ